MCAQLLSANIGEKHDLAKDHPEIVAKFEKYFRTPRTASPEWPVKAPAGSGKTSAASAL